MKRFRERDPVLVGLVSLLSLAVLKALARLNPGLSSLQPSLSALAKYPSPSHPAWTQRLPAIRAGYTQCGGSGSKFDARK